MSLDAYLKKEVTLRHRGHTLRLQVAQDLFSSFEVDVGTRLLLRTLADADRPSFRKVLDMGCGYGPLGLALRKSGQGQTVHLVDRDALAVELARHNAELNELSGVEAYGSLGYDDVPEGDFDLIVANLPGKAGTSVVSHLLGRAVDFLSRDGIAAVVVVSSLASAAASVLEAPGIEVLRRKDSSGYTAFHYKASSAGGESHGAGGDGIDLSVYRRDEGAHSYGGVDYVLDAAYGLGEFDSPSFRSRLLIAAIRDLRGRPVKRAVVFNPGVGHVPVALWKALAPEQIALVDRDLLALRYSRRNLTRNGCPIDRVASQHQVEIAPHRGELADLVVGSLREAASPAQDALTIGESAEQLAPGGRVLIAATSAAATRMVKRLRSQRLLRVVSRKRRKGNSVLVLER